MATPALRLLPGDVLEGIAVHLLRTKSAWRVITRGPALARALLGAGALSRDDWHAAAAATAAQSRAGRLSTLEQTVAALREELAHERAAALRQLDAAGKPKAAK